MAVKKAAVKYIPVQKDGEVIRVHPDQVEQHQRLGWQVKEEPTEEEK